MSKILQIIPADGWSAVFAMRSEETGAAGLEVVPLCSWALVEQEDFGEVFRSIAGYGATDVIDPCDTVESFVGYVHASDPEGPEKYREDAERHLRWLERRERKGRGAA